VAIPAPQPAVNSFGETALRVQNAMAAPAVPHSGCVASGYFSR
jgi:hypothetical protein